MGGGTVGRPPNTSSGNGLVANSDHFFARTTFSPSSSHSTNSSSSSSNNIPPLVATSAQRLFHGDHNENEGERSRGSFVDSVFNSVPTQTEVEHAVASFQSFIQKLPSSTSELDRFQPLLGHDDPRIMQSSGLQKVYDAFRLLQTVPPVQRMVQSISSDRTVWDAVMKNNELQEFKRSLIQAEVRRPERSNASGGEPDLVSMILRWILENMKLKVMELIDILKSLVSKSFESCQMENTNRVSKHQLEEIISSTVLLSTITLMIVLVTRAHGA